VSFTGVTGQANPEKYFAVLQIENDLVLKCYFFYNIGYFNHFKEPPGHLL